MHIQKGAVRLQREGLGKGKAWISKTVTCEALHLSFAWDLLLTDALCLEFKCNFHVGWVFIPLG